MQLKRYEACSIPEALKQVKAELGSDAVIFSTRTLPVAGRQPGGARVEVTAARQRGTFTRAAASAASSAQSQVRTRYGSGAPRARQAAAPVSTPGRSTAGHAMLCDGMDHYHHLLIRSGFHPDTASFLVGRASARVAPGGSAEAALHEALKGHISVCRGIGTVGSGRRVAAFIGASGVGKTTTLAKVAAACRVEQGARISVITTDTYRIGAVEQLRSYGRILDIPVDVAHSPADISSLLDRDVDSDLVLIDTAGRNYRDGCEIEALNRWLLKHRDIEAHLLLSATCSEDVLRNTIETFRQSRADRLIFTKIDEALRFGHLFSCIADCAIPVSYITTGQRVPEDIRTVSADMLSDLLVHGRWN